MCKFCLWTNIKVKLRKCIIWVHFQTYSSNNTIMKKTVWNFLDYGAMSLFFWICSGSIVKSALAGHSFDSWASSSLASLVSSFLCYPAEIFFVLPTKNIFCVIHQKYFLCYPSKIFSVLPTRNNFLQEFSRPRCDVRQDESEWQYNCTASSSKSRAQIITQFAWYTVKRL